MTTELTWALVDVINLNSDEVKSSFIGICQIQFIPGVKVCKIGL